MSHATSHFRPHVAGALSASLLFMAALLFVGAPLFVGVPRAAADPRPGSSGRVSGPTIRRANPSPKKRAAPKKASRASARKGALPGLGEGARGDKVLALQTRLTELHFDVEVNGAYDYATLQAVLGFQKVNDLPRTGRATDSVIAALETAVDPTPLIPTGGQNRIEVDLQRQYLALYKSGALFKVLPISSGSGKDFCVTDPDTGKTVCDKAITPGGSFRIRSRIIGWRESKLGLLYNPLYFNGGIAFHGAPIVPAQPASHGCVRIPMPSAEWFPNEVADGTAVYVFGAEKAPVPLGEKAPTDLRPNATAPPSTIDPALTVPNASTTTTPAAGATTTKATTTVAGTPNATTSTVVRPSSTLARPSSVPAATSTTSPTPLASTTVAITTITPITPITPTPPTPTAPIQPTSSAQPTPTTTADPPASTVPVVSTPATVATVATTTSTVPTSH